MSVTDQQTAKRLEMAREQIGLALAEVRTARVTGISEAVPRHEEYLTIPQLCARIGYKEQTLRNLMSIGEFKKGVHWFKPRGRLVFAWSVMELWVRTEQAQDEEIEPFYPEHNARSRKAR